MKTLLRFLALTLALSSCHGPPHYRVHSNGNNGEERKLTFSELKLQMVSSTAKLEVSRSLDGDFDCEASLALGSSGNCQYLGEALSPATEILEAHCGESCEALVRGLTVLVTASKPGTYWVEVQARLADGTVLADRTQAEFDEVAEIQGFCTASNHCPGPHAVLPGTTIRWMLKTVNATQRELAGDVVVTVDPPDIFEATVDYRYVSLRALRAGNARVRIQAGKTVREEAERVVDETEVVSGRVYLPQYWYPFDLSKDIVGWEAPGRNAASPAELVPVWGLRDGSTALGEARRVYRVTPEGQVGVKGTDGEEAQMTFLVGGPPCVSGRVQLEAKVGEATLDYSFDQYCAGN
ncbi:MAG: hypothetical protein QM765_28645 [Myxococcales bacterium]